MMLMVDATCSDVRLVNGDEGKEEKQVERVTAMEGILKKALEVPYE